MFIQLEKKDQDKVQAGITIKGTDHWDYNYNGDILFKNSDKINISKTHELGIVKNLTGDVNDWMIRVWNITNKKITVEVQLVWTGAVENSPIWLPGVDNKITINPNSFELLMGSVKFI